MKRNTYLSTIAITTALLIGVGCKSQLDVGNPNQPTLDGNVNNETGIVALAQGGVFSKRVSTRTVPLQTAG